MNARHINRLRTMLATVEDEASALREALRELEGKGAVPAPKPTEAQLADVRRVLARKGLLPKDVACEHLQAQSFANAAGDGLSRSRQTGAGRR